MANKMASKIMKYRNNGINGMAKENNNGGEAIENGNNNGVIINNQ
jgi:hypothetical protein